VQKIYVPFYKNNEALFIYADMITKLAVEKMKSHYIFCIRTLKQEYRLSLTYRGSYGGVTSIPVAALFQEYSRPL